MTVKQIQARLTPLQKKIARLKAELDSARARQKELKDNLAAQKKKDGAAKTKPKPKTASTRRKTTPRAKKK